MTSQSDFALADEDLRDVGIGIAHGLAVTIRLSLRQAEAENYDEDGWPGTKPIQWPPTVASGIDECSSESGCQEAQSGRG